MKNIKLLILMILSFNYLNAEECIFLGAYKAVTYEKVLFYNNKINYVDTLEYVAKTANVEKLEKSLSKCSREEILTFKDNKGLNLLENLFFENSLNVDVLNFLLKNYTFTFNNDYFFDYFKTAFSVDVYTLKKLLDLQNQNINMKDKDGKTFLHYLVIRDSLSLYELQELLNLGINVKAKDKNGVTALDILNKKLKIIKETTKSEEQIKKLEMFIKLVKLDREFNH